jgi:hypothetical protein
MEASEENPTAQEQVGAAPHQEQQIDDPSVQVAAEASGNTIDPRENGDGTGTTDNPHDSTDDDAASISDDEGGAEAPTASEIPEVRVKSAKEDASAVVGVALTDAPIIMPLMRELTFNTLDEDALSDEESQTAPDETKTNHTVMENNTGTTGANEAIEEAAVPDTPIVAVPVEDDAEQAGQDDVGNNAPPKELEIVVRLADGKATLSTSIA